jgi:MFS family permease
MWELYAMWTWLVAFLSASAADAGGRAARLLAFASIGVAGAIGAAAGGWWADRAGRTRVTVAAMAVSGGCCLLSPALYGAPWLWLVPFGVLWGASVIADSAQFSAAVTELTEPDYVGTALTLQTSLGFALTMVTIWGLPWLAEVAGWQFAFLALAPGPLLGCVFMGRLRRRPDAARMAAGRR